MARELDVRASIERGGFRLQVDAYVDPGEVLGVLGPNGAGKTTLLRAVAGLTALDAGHVRLGDLVLDEPATGTFVPVEDRPVGVVFQDYRLFPHLDVAGNVAFAARSRGLGRAASRVHAYGWMERLGLRQLASRRPAQLSGGQAQRVALARALAAEPGMLLLDEPLSALDARTRLDVRTELRQHLEGFAGPVVVVTHDPLEAMVLSDTLLVVEDGRVVQRGAPDAVARRPATTYVASLVGLNLHRGELSDGIVALDAGGSLVVAADSVGHGRVLVAARPSAVAVHTERPYRASPRNVWPATVTSLELLADRVRAQMHGHPPMLVDLTPAAVAELRLRPGREVWLSVKATDLEVYADAAVPEHLGRDGPCDGGYAGPRRTADPPRTHSSEGSRA